MTLYIGVDIHARQQTLSYATANKGTVTASPLQALVGRRLRNATPNHFGFCE
jgi:hypothetical protein